MENLTRNILAEAVREVDISKGTIVRSLEEVEAAEEAELGVIVQI